MKLTSLLKKGNLLPRIRATAKEAAIREILALLGERGALEGARVENGDADELLRELMEREGKGSTGLAGGVGYPHLRREGFRDFLLAFATAPQGVEYEAPDGQPVRLILLAIVPPEKNALLLGVVACLSQLMADRDLLERMIGAADRDEMWDLLEDAGLEVKESITAGDIMKREFVAARPDMTLADAAALMHHEHLDVLPVLDPEGRLLGEVSARGLFAACMPPYFAELPSMRFARDFDAFEHFFQDKAHTKVAGILSEEVTAIDAEAPLAELIARMARKGVPTLYVAEQGRLVGVIDNFSIIDKVLSI